MVGSQKGKEQRHIRRKKGKRQRCGHEKASEVNEKGRTAMRERERERCE